MRILGDAVRKGFFRRPQFVVAIALVVLFFACDFGLAFLLVPKVPYTPNRFYHHALIPNLSSEARWGFAHYPIATDSLGLRDKTPREVPPVGTHPRLLFLGNSFTEGVGVPYERTFVGIIADRIRRAGGDTEVFNGGVASHSPRLYFLHLLDLVERQGARFDEIVVFIDVSDIQDELAYEGFTPGRFTLSLALRYLKQYAEQNSLVAYVLFNRLPGLRPYLDALRSWVSRQSQRKASLDLVSLASLAAAAAAQPTLQPPEGITRPAREVWDNPNYYMARDTWIDSDNAFRSWGAYGLKLARQNSGAARELCREQGHDDILCNLSMATLRSGC